MPVPKPQHLSSPRLTTHESGVLLREALGEQLRPRVDGGRSRAGARRPHSPHSIQPAPRRCTARADPPSPPLEEHVAPPCFVTSLHPRQHRVVCAPAPPMHALLARSGAHTTPTLPPPPRAQAGGTARGSSGPTRRSTCAPSIAPAVFNATIIAAGVAHRRRRRSLAASTKRHRPSRSRSRSVALAVALAGALAVAVAVCLGSGQSPWPCAWEVAKWP